MLLRPQASADLFSLLCRTDKTTPLVNKGQPRGPGNGFIWDRALLLPGSWRQSGGRFQPGGAALLCGLQPCPLLLTGAEGVTQGPLGI